MESKMEISEAKRFVRLREWSAMIQACKASGKTVKAWCKENGISIKTYYYRLRRIRLAALQEPEKSGVYFPATGASAPVFAKLPFTSAGENMNMGSVNVDMSAIAVTVRMGIVAIDINNSADPNVVSQALRLLREIC